MNLRDFRQLKKLLTLAAANDQDHEALTAFRQATKIIATSGYTWEMVLDRVVSVVSEVEPAPASGDDDLDAAFDLALRSARGEFRGTLESIREQYAARGFISPRQREVVMSAADRAADRHPGGRVR